MVRPPLSLAMPRATQPALFELRDDHRRAGERSAAERYEAPRLFARLERSETGRPCRERRARRHALCFGSR